MSRVVKVRLADGAEHFFGSVKAIYDVFSKEETGISYGSLGVRGLPYGNSKCTITRYELIGVNKKEINSWKFQG